MFFHFKDRIDELEANILAYQDLLITKEAEIGDLTDKLNTVLASGEITESAKATIESLHQQLQQLTAEFVNFRHPRSHTCCAKHYYSNGRTGKCSEVALTH